MGSKKKKIILKKTAKRAKNAPMAKKIQGPAKNSLKLSRAKASPAKKGKKIEKKSNKKMSGAEFDEPAPVRKINFLENNEFKSYLNEMVGEDGMQIVKRISEEEVSDVDLAEEMDMKANIIRKHLYKLYEAKVVTYRRHRSKTGWFTYYWRLHPERVREALNTDRESQMKELRDMLSYERENAFYECRKKCTRAAFDDAIELKFKCPRCETQLEHKENTARVKEIETQIFELMTRHRNAPAVNMKAPEATQVEED